MNDSIADILGWLYERPLQDNPEWLEQSTVHATDTWEEWLNRGRGIRDLESRLIQMLEQNQDPVNRSAIALALGFVGGDGSIKALIVSLMTDVPMVAMEAAASLGRLNKSEAIEPLCKAMSNADANVRASACTALGGLGGSRALACLKDAEKDNSPIVQAAAKEALQRKM